MKRRDFIKLTGTSAAAGLVLSSSGFPLPLKFYDRPNILFIMIDDLRPELGCYGVEDIQSPHIDRIAEQGVVFNNAYCSQALCNPARTSLLTGKRPESLQIWDNSRHFRNRFKGLTTLPQVFKKAGYQTISIGKIFHGTLPDPPSWNRRRVPPLTAPYYMSGATNARQVERTEMAKKLGYTQRWIDAYLRGPSTEALNAPDSAYRDGSLTEMALKTMEEHKAKQPFFLSVGFAKPHLPFVAPKKYWDLYDPDRIPLAENNFLPKDAPGFAINSHTEFACYEDLVQIPNPTEGQISEDLARRLKHGYYACVSFIDAQIGRIIDYLKTSDLDKNTIVVITGEHGYKLGEHGAWGKMTNYEVDVRFPFIISAPGRFRSGTSTSALVEIVDIYPTICEMVGLAPPTGQEGLSFLPILQNPERPWKKAAFSQFPRGFANSFMGRSMRTSRYRFTEWRNRIDQELIATELYDHENDWQENVNIAGVPGGMELVPELSSMMAAGWKAALPD